MMKKANNLFELLKETKTFLLKEQRLMPTTVSANLAFMRGDWELCVGTCRGSCSSSCTGSSVSSGTSRGDCELCVGTCRGSCSSSCKGGSDDGTW